jgi:hypothetical protein
VASIRFINIYNFTRIQTKYGDLVGFFYQDPNTLMPVFLHPWQVMHLLLTSFEQIYMPYGRSILDGARRDFKRLRLMEDAALIYRITRAPEKRIFSIPIGNIPANQINAFITEIARQFKKHKFVDPATGQINERYSPLIQEDDFFLPKRPDGSGPTVETLPGAQNLDEIEDILYFKKKMIAATKIPFSRVGIGERTDSDGRALAASSPEFAKAIQWVQREAMTGLKKVVIVHLALQGYSIKEIKEFDLFMTSASAIDELYRIETWNTRAEIIGNLKETDLFPDEWILETFTNLTRDEIEQMQEKKKKQAAEQPAEGEEGGEGGGLMDTVAPPPGGAIAPPGGEAGGGLGALGEAVDEEDKKLIQEFTEFKERVDTNGSRFIDLEDAPKYEHNRERKSIMETTGVEWFVNNNEMDNFPRREGDDAKITVLVESQIDATTRDEVKKQNEAILLVEAEGVKGDNTEMGGVISVIANKIDAPNSVPSDKNLLNEGAS